MDSCFFFLILILLVNGIDIRVSGWVGNIDYL